MTQTTASNAADLSQVNPSFVLNFFDNHWTLSPSGSSTKPRTFSYTHIISSLLDDINACRIPVDYLDLFDAAHIPFYDGCLVVEMQDNRPQGQRAAGLAANGAAPPVQRVILRPTAETLWADIRMLNERHGQKWSDQDALSLEARIVNVTAPPLCLDPDPLVNRITNLAVRASTPNHSSLLKRKQSVVEDVEDEMAKSKRLKIMGMMNPRANRPSAATFNQLRFFSMRKGGPPAPTFPDNSVSPRPPLPAGAASAVTATATATSSPVPVSALAKPKLKRKSDEDEDEGNAKNKRKVAQPKKPGRQSDYGDSPAAPSYPLPAIAVAQTSNESIASRPPSTRPLLQHTQPPAKKEEDSQQQSLQAQASQQPQLPPATQPQVLPHPHPHQMQVPQAAPPQQQQPMQNLVANMNMSTFPQPKSSFLTLPANRKKALPQQPMQGQPQQVPTQQMTPQQQHLYYQQYAAHAQAQAQAAHAQAQAQAQQAQLQAGLKMLPQAQQTAAQNRFNAPLMSRSPRPQAGMPQHPQIPPQYRQPQHLPHGVPHGVPGQSVHNAHPAGVNPELPVGVGFAPGPYANFNFPLQLPAMGMGAYPQAGWRIPAPAPVGARPQQVQGQMLPMGHPGQ